MTNFAPPWPGVPGVADLLAGGSLSTGPTGLAGLQGAALNGTVLPYASNPLAGQVMGPGLAAQVPVGVGRQAATSALNLGPATGGLLSRLPSLPKPSLSGLGLTAPSKLKGGLYGLAGGVGANLVDQLNVGGNDSPVDQFLTGAAFGGGTGAAFGGLGAAIGAPVGGAINVLGNTLGLWGNDKGEDAPDPVTVLATAMDTAGLTPEYEEAILQTYETQMALADRLEGDAKKQAEDAALEAAGQMVLQAMQTQQAQAMRPQMGAGGGPGLLAMQQQAQQIFEPIAQDIETSAGLYAQQMSGIRPNLPASYQSVADAQVARELTSADKLANAYRAQAALTPLVDRLTQYQSDYNSFASQLFQQQQAATAAAMAQGGGGMGLFGGGGAAGGTDLLAQLQPA